MHTNYLAIDIKQGNVDDWPILPGVKQIICSRAPTDTEPLLLNIGVYHRAAPKAQTRQQEHGTHTTQHMPSLDPSPPPPSPPGSLWAFLSVSVPYLGSLVSPRRP
ncbi:hypothetical protein CPAR01_06416 [Colletotrichum paranaense]|uniref:Uncharacterized protein n=1 Tax=Colletotrichum paranaense TaxID=1914294 RepID=A0ABQ9SMZ3_9PEZI|nr:uncharacterized protein CPAR01_06416 [Colletotrichum paranaense]KAK1540427.1 hypothetical protein CPAR01_06416 [Colletotrichum paranaense]